MRRLAAVGLVWLTMALSACGGGEHTEVPLFDDSSPGAGAQLAHDWKAKELVAAMKAALAKEGSADIRTSLSGTGQTDFTAVGQINIGTPYAAQTQYDVDGQLSTVLIVGSQGFARKDDDAPGTWRQLSAPEVKEQSEGAGIDGYFAAFTAGASEARYLGRETIRGFNAAKFTLDVDSAAGLAAQGKAVPSNAPASLTYLVWVDDDDVMRQVQTDLGQQHVMVEIDVDTAHFSPSRPPAGSVLK